MRRLVTVAVLAVLVAVPARGQDYALPTPSPSPSPTPVPCTTPAGVQRVRLDKRLFPNVRKHYRVAVSRGWPKVLVLHRKRAARRSAKVLQHIGLRAGYDRDEYPPAIGRGVGKGLRQGRRPRGWVADVGYVRSPESVVAAVVVVVELAPFCDGTKFRYAFS